VADLTIDKTPTQNQSMNKPESGTYGEKVEVDRLKKELPSTGGPGRPAPEEPQRATPTQNKPVEGLPAAPLPGGPPGVPDVLMHPGGGNVAPGQPMAPGGGAQDISQARIALLDALASSQDVSSETREWAQIVLEMMIDATRP
tara:strand:- start:2164 stop:2592 length:429 start_codon:yes stop_codon:yes gene_type:complete